jgi:peptide/nickel transport system substrate-binding protein
VTTRDVIASLKRWMARDTIGGKLGEYTDSMEVVDDKSFTLKLKRPMALVPFALGSAVGQIPVIMRESDAERPDEAGHRDDRQRAVPLQPAEWRSGAKVVYDRNPDYVPRSEPADGLAGGRVVKVDRVEWMIMPDPATAAAALADRRDRHLGAAEPGPDPGRSQATSDIKVERYSNLSNQAMLRPNHLHPPFNNPKARLALAYATDQADFLAGGLATSSGGSAATPISSAAAPMAPKPAPKLCQARSRQGRSCWPRAATRARSWC